MDYVGASTPCGPGTTCEAGECVAWVCPKPGESYCQGQDVKSCSASGLTSTVEATCTNSTCVATAGAAECKGVCGPTQTRCVGNGVQTCDAMGAYGPTTACPAATPHCAEGKCTQPPSCSGLGAVCGPQSNESCCNSPTVKGGTFNRDNDATYKATVSTLRLDRYEVTVGRFRKFVSAVVGGWTPPAGSGKHAHLNGGLGLASSAAAAVYESGWDATWNAQLPAAKATWDDSGHLACDPVYQTWTSNSGSNERKPINCVNWYEAAAFCIWDGGFLPSNAEWNFAAAGGSAQRTFPWSSPASSSTTDCSYANYYGAGDDMDYCVMPGTGSTMPVGSYSPKGDGLFGQADLGGNVYEWNADSYVKPYATKTCDDCVDVTKSTFRVGRGGAFFSDSGNLLSSDSYYFPPDTRYFYQGLRCARTP